MIRNLATGVLMPDALLPTMWMRLPIGGAELTGNVEDGYSVVESTRFPSLPIAMKTSGHG